MSFIANLYIFIAKKRVWISRIIFIALAIEYLVWHWYNLTAPESFGTSWVIGTLLILLGTFIRCWSAGMLHKTKRVVQEGPYALARNPLYIGSFVIACGFGLYLNDPWFWLGMLVIFIVIYPKTIQREETKLRALFQEDWDSYHARVGIFWPIKIDWNAVRQPWSYALWLKNKEHKTLLMISLGLIAKLLKIVIF